MIVQHLDSERRYWVQTNENEGWWHWIRYCTVYTGGEMLNQLEAFGHFGCKPLFYHWTLSGHFDVDNKTRSFTNLFQSLGNQLRILRVS